MDQIKIKKLKKIIETNPLWYQIEEILYFIKLFGHLKLGKNERSYKKTIIKLLENSKFYYSSEGYNWDQWKEPVEYAVIHHTSSKPTISLKELNILGLRLYITQFLKDKDVKNQPLYSGHYWYNKIHNKKNMTFVSYHYLVRPNGKIIQMVDDNTLLWHAGNLDVNRKSIGIALAGKFLNIEPTKAALQSVAEIIRKHKITKYNVYGHNEVIKKDLLGETDCPGTLFVENWKNKLIKML